MTHNDTFRRKFSESVALRRRAINSKRRIYAVGH